MMNWGRTQIGNSEKMEDRFNTVIEGTKIYYDSKFLYQHIGYNFKSTELAAAFGLAQLKKLSTFLKIRRRNFERYLYNLKDCPYITLPKDNLSFHWLAFPFLTKDRYGLLHYLEANNIQTRLSFSGNITRHPAYKKYAKPFKNADIIMNEGCLVGCHHGLDSNMQTHEEIDYVCNKIKEYFKTKYTI